MTVECLGTMHDSTVVHLVVLDLVDVVLVNLRACWLPEHIQMLAAVDNVTRFETAESMVEE